MSELTINRLGAVIAGELGGYFPGSSPYGRWYEQETGAKGFASSAFCAMGLSWAARQAGIPTSVIPTFAWTPSGADFYRRLGTFTKGVSGVRRGDIWFSSCAGIGRISHVGWVESVNSDGTFVTLEFNTAATINGDQRNGRTVARKRRNSACSLGGYGRPEYPGISAVLRPEAGVITPVPVQEDDMNATQEAKLDRAVQIGEALVKYVLDPEGQGYKADARVLGILQQRHDAEGKPRRILDTGDGQTLREDISASTKAAVAETSAAYHQLVGLVGRTPTGDLDVDALATALLPALGDAVAGELGQRLIKG